MRKKLLLKFLILICAGLYLTGCTVHQEPISSVAFTPESSDPIAGTHFKNETVRFLEIRVKNNPEDFIAYNKLASEYLRLMRETGDANFLNSAAQAAETSIKILPPKQNKEGLAALALVKYNSHEFSVARDLAAQLVELEPERGYAYQILGDAHFELGEYEAARNAYQKMKKFGGIQPLTKSAIEQRLARLADLDGDLTRVKKHYTAALSYINSMPPSEATAYCLWQLGETAFAAGDYDTAEKHYRNALETLPNYAKALASMGKVHAANNDIAGAVEFYKRAAERLPDLTFIAALGDLYKIAGKTEDARRQYDLVEQIGRLSQINGTLYNRALALYYADHDQKLDEAYAMAAREYQIRRDIYGADTLAWTALKVGKMDESREKIREALRFGTKDARLFYHAGVIAQTSGKKGEAKKYLRLALALNPKFNLLQAENCRRTLENL